MGDIVVEYQTRSPTVTEVIVGFGDVVVLVCCSSWWVLSSLNHSGSSCIVVVILYVPVESIVTWSRSGLLSRLRGCIMTIYLQSEMCPGGHPFLAVSWPRPKGNTDEQKSK